MPKLTKLQLADQNHQLRLEISALRIDLEIARKPKVEKQSRGFAPYVMPAWQIDRLAAMTMARDAAIKSHSMVKVQS